MLSVNIHHYEGLRTLSGGVELGFPSTQTRSCLIRHVVWQGCRSRTAREPRTPPHALWVIAGTLHPQLYFLHKIKHLNPFHFTIPVYVCLGASSNERTGPPAETAGNPRCSLRQARKPSGGVGSIRPPGERGGHAAELQPATRAARLAHGRAGAPRAARVSLAAGNRMVGKASQSGTKEKRVKRHISL